MFYDFLQVLAVYFYELKQFKDKELAKYPATGK